VPYFHLRQQPMVAYQHVLQNGQAWNDPPLLECANNPLLAISWGFRAEIFSPSKQIPPELALDVTGGHVKERRFARPVRSDEASNLVLSDRDAHVIQRPQAAEIDADPLGEKEAFFPLSLDVSIHLLSPLNGKNTFGLTRIGHRARRGYQDNHSPVYNLLEFYKGPQDLRQDRNQHGADHQA